MNEKKDAKQEEPCEDEEKSLGQRIAEAMVKNLNHNVMKEAENDDNH